MDKQWLIARIENIKPLKFIHTLKETEPEMARQEYITRNIFFFSFIVIFSFTLISFVLYLADKMPLDTLIIYSSTLIALFFAMFLTEKGYWRSVGIIPPVLMYFIAINSNYVGGIDAPGNFLYALLVIFVAIIYGYRKMWIALVICLATYLCLVWMISIGHIIPYRTAETFFINRVVITSGSLLIIALMIWVLSRSYKKEIDVRIKAEEALLESEESYRTMFENTGTSMILIEEDMTISMANGEFVRNSGYSSDEINGRMKWTELVHPDEIGRMTEQHRLRRESPRNALPGYELRYITKTGDLRDALLNIQLVPGTKKSVASLIDITERKQAEKKLMNSEEKFRTLAESSPFAIMMHQGERWIYANRAAVEISGYTEDDLYKMHFWDFVHPDHRNMGKQRGLDRQQGKAVPRDYELKVITKNGAEKWVSLTGNKIQYEDKPTALISVTDVTERKRAEKLLKQSEEQYRLLADHMKDQVWIMNLDLKVTYISPSVEKLLGYTLNELKNLPLDKILTSASFKAAMDFFSTEMPKALAASSDYILARSLELEFCCKDGRTLWEESMFSFIRDDKGKPLSILGEARDVTERKQAEEKLQHTLENLKNAVGTTINVLVSAVESRDSYTAGHQSRSANLACAIAVEMELDREKIEGIRMAGSIHDIGKLSVPAEILSKPTKLTGIEFSLIKEHSRKGYEMLKDVESPWPLAQIVYQHHERMDGSGYPRNLKGDEILIESQILAVADVVEAMASHRPYRPTLGIEAALEEIEKNKGLLYDDAVADACLRLFREKGYQLI